MTVYFDPDIAGSPLCGCGRLANKIHCPNCGSYVIYRTQQTIEKLKQDGSRELVRIIKCRRCGNVFDDWQWQQSCGAPYLVSKRKAKETDNKRIEVREEVAAIDWSKIEQELKGNKPQKTKEEEFIEFLKTDESLRKQVQEFKEKEQKINLPTTEEDK